MDSLIAKYRGEKYGGDVVSKARQIKEIANDILRYRTDFIKQSDKILDGLKFVVNQYNATEKECIGLVKKMALSKPSVRVMSKGIDNLQTLIKQKFTRENVEKLATLWENMLKEYNEARKEELKQLQERLASGNLPQLEDSDIAFYEAMPTMLSELGISLSTKDQANLLSCLRIKGEVESIDLKRFGLTPESGISEKELKKLSETITLKYDAEYYNKKNTEVFNQKLDLFNSFITDVNMNAVALGEAAVDLGVDMAVGAYKIGVEPVGRLGELFAAWNLKNLGGMSQEEFDQKFNDYCNYADNLTSGLGSALVNVGNTNLEENTVLSPLYYTATGFNEYMQGNMTHEEKIAYFKKVIESVMIVEGGIKGVQKGSTIVKSKLEASKVKAGGVEGLNQVDELTKSRNTVVKEGAVKSGSSKVGDFKNLKGTTVDDILDRIPDDATLRELTPVKGGATEGFEFKWIQDNQTYRVRVHNIDPGAPVGSNASQGWIVRIQRGRQYYDYTIEGFQPAKYTNNPNGEFFDSTITNNTHIPIKDPYQ